MENDAYSLVINSKNDSKFKSLYEEYIGMIKSEDLRQLSLVAEQSGRYEEMMSFLKLQFENKRAFSPNINGDDIHSFSLNSDEIMLFSIAFSNIFNKHRQAIEYILAVDHNQTFNLMTQRTEWKDYKKKAEDDFI